MTPTAAKGTLALAIVLGLGQCIAMGADGDPPTPSRHHGASAKTPPTTVADAEWVRKEAWRKHELPPVEQIESIIAESYSHPLPVPDIGPFVVPKKYYAELLNQFGDAEPDTTASSGSPELGTIRIMLVGGRSIRACWFWEGHKDRLCFSWCGMRYRAVGKRFAADETLEVDALIRRIHSREVLHEDGHSTPLTLPRQR